MIWLDLSPAHVVYERRGCCMDNETKNEVSEPVGNEGIVYQNKDITSKYFADEYKETLFKAYGLELPDIVRMEPTELPTVEVNDMMMDNLFLLTDGSYAIVDYESKYSEENKVKYLGYIARVFKRVYNQSKTIPKLRMIVVYTADVKKGTTRAVLDLGANKLTLTEAFLSEMNANQILKECDTAIRAGEDLTPIQKLRLMLCALSEKGKEAKRKALRRVIDLTREIPDEIEQKQILSGMIAFSDKIISREDAEEIRRMLNMTKVGRIIYEEQMEAVNTAVNKKSEDIATNLIIDGASLESVSRNTGLEMSVVEELAKKVAEKKEAANRIGISPPAYLRYEAGDRTPSAQMIKEIARAMNTSVDFLVGDTDNPATTIIEIDKNTDNVLFQIVEICVNMDVNQQKRVLTHIKNYHW